MASFFLLLMYISVAKGQVITVKQDGTGDFDVIQDAVNASSDGDTILVYPGAYFENVDLTDKCIVLTSTWRLSQQDSIIDQTIIDGNQSGSCIRSLENNCWSSILGFTLQHGTGTNYLENLYPWLYGSGGGVYIENSELKIINCHLKYNFAWCGGGVYSVSSSLMLFGNTIAHNWSYVAGGIGTTLSIVTFDSVNLNNVYLNYSSMVSDIVVGYDDTIAKIWLDTCTVMNPDRYYIGKFSDWGVHMERPPISVLHGKIEQVNSDLYVSPSGDDGNSGLTPDTPLKTISFALLKIASDSINLKTVHVADGVYSNSLTGEHTPLQFKNNVNLVGQSRENTILDCENKYECARFAFGQDYTYVKNISFQNGNGTFTYFTGGITIGYSKKIVLDSISLINATSNYFIHGIYSDSDDTLIINNSLIKECKGIQTIVPFNHFYELPRYIEFNSTQFDQNGPDMTSDTSQGHITVYFVSSETIPDLIYAKIVNCLFNDNFDFPPWSPYPGATAIATIGDIYLDIVNSTFANNITTNPWGGAVGATGGSDINFYNCILYGNEPYQIYLNYDLADQADTVRVNYSLVEDGKDSIISYGPFNYVEWGEGNLDDDPVFLGSEEFPYAIDAGSPCIDAGTQNLPRGIKLPEYDIAGNPRIWGESVDMGAYEYGPWVGTPEAPSSKFKVQSSKLMEVSPNPFSYGTYVSYELKENGRLNISVYSMSGMKVRTLVNNTGMVGDKGSFYWDGRDEYGNSLSAGTYILRMTIDGWLVETVKVVKEK
ncbi:MAG: DUF1565 domain-containing protein [Bacteroidales bacterium]|nr:DUF1565 domain-containing protein [Bacteroidales bacterium]